MIEARSYAVLLFEEVNGTYLSRVLSSASVRWVIFTLGNCMRSSCSQDHELTDSLDGELGMGWCVALSPPWLKGDDNRRISIYLERSLKSKLIHSQSLRTAPVAGHGYSIDGGQTPRAEQIELGRTPLSARSLHRRSIAPALTAVPFALSFTDWDSSSLNRGLVYASKRLERAKLTVPSLPLQQK